MIKKTPTKRRSAVGFKIKKVKDLEIQQYNSWHFGFGRALASFAIFALVTGLFGQPVAFAVDIPNCDTDQQLCAPPSCDTNPQLCPPIDLPGTGTIIVNKEVVGGSLSAEDFMVLVLQGQTPVAQASGTVTAVLQAGTYGVGENPEDGYEQTSIICIQGDLAFEFNAIELAVGQTVICTITNTFEGTQLKLVKNVVGDISPDSWTLSATAQGDSNSFSDAGGSGVFHPVTPGVEYILAESPDVSDYEAGPWSCDGGSFNMDTNGITLENGEEVTCTITNTYVSSADVSITKTVDLGEDQIATEGETITYTLSVTNNDNADYATSVTVSDILPSEVTYVSHDPNSESYAGGVWNVGTLAPGETKSLTITVTINQGLETDVIDNTATVASQGPTDPNPSNNSDSVSFGVGDGKFVLNVNISNGQGDGSGSVSSTSTPAGPTEIACDKNTQPEGCSAVYGTGTEVTLIASPHEGSNFTGSWVAGPCNGSNNPVCTFTMNSNVSVTAHFSLNSQASSNNSGGGGGGGGGGAGGPAPLPLLTPTPTPTPTVAGASTNSPSGGTNPPAGVLGDSTLPRTGMPILPVFFALGIAAAILNKKLKLI